MFGDHAADSWLRPFSTFGFPFSKLMAVCPGDAAPSGKTRSAASGFPHRP